MMNIYKNKNTIMDEDFFSDILDDNQDYSLNNQKDEDIEFEFEDALI